jgi:hypothetical protein
MQHKGVVATMERRCKTVNDTTRKLVGYDVTYRLETRKLRCERPSNPAPPDRVKDGQVIATPSGAGWAADSLPTGRGWAIVLTRFGGRGRRSRLEH